MDRAIYLRMILYCAEDGFLLLLYSIFFCVPPRSCELKWRVVVESGRHRLLSARQRRPHWKAISCLFTLAEAEAAAGGAP